MRFAALIRVSTERQEKTGESLSVQKTEIQKAVQQLEGEVVSWYGGQEHATTGWEKREIERLLADAAKKSKRWDAIIVTNADRWSRDNECNHKGLEVFRKQNIRFFVGTSEYDLYNPEQNMFLEMSAVFGSFQARHQNKKSIMSRIHRAKRGYPTGGKLPFGRTFDRSTGKWGIDKEKQEVIQDVARRYLAGEALPKLAEEYGMNATNLHKVLTKRSGTRWKQKFKSEELNINEVVEITIPPLLPEETVQAVLEKMQANKTYSHGQVKNKYLLSRMIFCDSCGYAMFGQTNHTGYRYYRHTSSKRERTCKVRKWVRADEVEDAVIRHLFHTFGNPKAVEEAIKAAIPDLKRIEAERERLSRLDDSIQQIDKGIKRVLRLILNGTVTEEEAEQELKKSRERKAELQEERERLSAHLGNAPTAEEAEQIGKAIASRFERRRLSKQEHRLIVKKNVANDNFDRMTWQEKRSLCETVFSGNTPDGRRMGVYVSWLPDGKTKFIIRGHFIDRSFFAPLDGKTKDWLVNADYAEQGSVTKCALRLPGTGLRGCRSC